MLNQKKFKDILSRIKYTKTYKDVNKISRKETKSSIKLEVK